MSGILGFTFTLQFHLSKHDRNHLGKSNSIIKFTQGVVHKLRLQDEVGSRSKNVHFLSTFIPYKMSTQDAGG